MKPSVTVYDYFMIGFYLLFMVVIGFLHRSKSKDTSDYFRAGGAVSWWLVGASSFVLVFSAWTFVGCAGKVYASGTLASLIFLLNAAALLFTFWLGPKIRRLRVITWVSAIEIRYGKIAEQFYAWVTMVIGFAIGGVALYTLAVFMAPIFGLSVELITVIVGAVITLMAASGGLKGLMASDFVQCMLIVFIAVMTAFVVLQTPEVGGFAGLLDKIPSGHLRWSEYEATQVLWFWGIAIFINQIISMNNVQAGASKYISVRNEREARLAVLIPFAGMFLLPVVAFIPPLAATFLLPDLEAMYPGLNNPGEAAYVAVAMKVLPRGMVGLLASAIFAASVTSLNAALTINSSVFVKNIYQPLFRKTASEKELLLISRVTMVVLGLILIVIGLKIGEIKNLPLFDITLLIAGLISIPLMIPLFLALIIKKTPSWSSWSTVLLGLGTAAYSRFYVSGDFISGLLGLEREFTQQEMIDAKFAFTIFATTIVSVSWFLLSRLFYRYEPQWIKNSVNEFCRRIDTPIDEKAEGVEDSTAGQAAMVGRLCVIYGAVVLGCLVIPNDLSGRLCFVFCGGGMAAVGFLLLWAAKKKRKDALELESVHETGENDMLIENVDVVLENEPGK